MFRKGKKLVLQRRVEELEVAVADMRASMLDETVHELREKNSKLEQVVKEQREAIGVLHEEKSTLRERCTELEQAVEKLRHSNSLLQKGKATLEEVLVDAVVESAEEEPMVVFVGAWTRTAPPSSFASIARPNRRADIPVVVQAQPGADPSNRTGASPEPSARVPSAQQRAVLAQKLIAAAKYGHAEDINRLLGHGADVQGRDGDGRTPLHWAARNGHLVPLHLLVDGGAAVDAADRKGNTPLHTAAYWNRVAIVKALLAAAASINAPNASGNTPLHEAAWYHHEMAVRALLEGGADPNVRNYHGKMPRDIAWMDSIRALL